VDVNIVWYDKNRLKFKMEPVDDFDGSDLRKFVHQVKDDLLKPVWKSQPIPQKQEGPVLNIVADNFESQVMTSESGDRDVLFYIYAPWCGHCKQFDSVYKKLAKEMGGEQLIFTKMDGNANDLPPGYEIRGYPTIFFIPSDKKHEPALYDGDRSIAHVRDFIKRRLTLSPADQSKDKSESEQVKEEL